MVAQVSAKASTNEATITPQENSVEVKETKAAVMKEDTNEKKTKKKVKKD